MRDRNKGFTLAELLIVVAIIAVLVAIAIPIFTTHLEKSKESVDMANARSAYSEVMTAALLQDTSNVNYEDGVYWLSIELKQKKDDWQSATPITIGGVKSTETNRWFGTPGAGGTCTVYYSAEPYETHLGNSVDYASTDTNHLQDLVAFEWTGGTASESSGGGGTDTSPDIVGLNTPVTRATTNWAINQESKLLVVSSPSNRASLTAAPIKLSSGATATLSADSGYDAAFWILEYVEGVGFKQVTDGKWVNSSKGISTYTSENDNTYILVNTKKSTGDAISSDEANENTTLTITGNSSVSTAGLTATSVTGASTGGLKNSSNGTTGGTISTTETTSQTYATVSNVSKGSILSLTGNENYNLAYYFVDSSGTILYDSGWTGDGASSSMVVPEDCTVYVQAKAATGATTIKTDSQREEAISCFQIYS